MRLEIAVTGELEKAKERLNSAKGNMEDQILSTAESLSSMTLEEKVAQMFMVRCPSPGRCRCSGKIPVWRVYTLFC